VGQSPLLPSRSAIGWNMALSKNYFDKKGGE